MKLAIVVPARDEQQFLPRCLSSLKPFRDCGDSIVVVDNGSRDATGSIARDRGFETLVESRPGRGHAVAAGYRAVKDRALWILVVHADMVVADGTREALAAALMASPECVTGALGHRIDDARRVFRSIEAGNRWRARVLRLPYGDQAQFFRVETVERTGGFPQQADGEDLHLALRLRAAGPVVYVDHPVTIPSRHWSRGVVRTTLANWKSAARFVRSRPGI